MYIQSGSICIVFREVTIFDCIIIYYIVIQFVYTIYTLSAD